MSRIRIDYIINGTYPINVYVSDIYGNNTTYIGTINSGPVPPEISFISIPSIFNTASSVMVTTIDANSCERFEIVPCDFEPYYSIITQNDIDIITQDDIVLVIQTQP